MHLHPEGLFLALLPLLSIVSAAPSGPNPLVKLSIGLEVADPNLLERTLLEVSDPLSARYGQHLTRDEAVALVAPRAESADVVKRWLAQAGVPAHEIRHEGRWVHVSVPEEHAKRLLAENADQSNSVKRSLPNGVSQHIALVRRSSPPPDQMIRNEHNSGSHTEQPWAFDLQDLEIRGPDLDNCHTLATPACIRNWYKIPAKKETPAKNNCLGVVGFYEQTAQFEQLAEFQRRFDPFSKGGNFTSQGINGGENPQETPDQQYPSGEVNGDTQYTVALAYDIPVRYYPVGGIKTDYIPDLDIPEDVDNEGLGVEPMLEFAQGLMDLKDKDLPLVMSISWGSNEQEYPKKYAKEACNVFGQLGTRGVSILVASGNNGPGASCQTNDGKKKTRFTPGFPNSCPYVTAVGGTTLASNTSAGGRSGESIGINFSGGGFSEYFDRPQWQDKTVKEYLKKNPDKFEKYYNKKGRAFPDLAAHAGPANIPIMNHGVEQLVGGTSIATPIVASMIALINNQRLKDKKPPMGFLNPFIYQADDKVFTDITEGKSIGCLGESIAGLPSPVVPGAGWEAVKGWDLVTGRGAPKFEELKKAACR